MQPIMIKRIVLFLILIVSIQNLWSQTSYRLPKVLFITSGADQGRGTVSDGVVAALQAFNRTGTFVRLENRKILLQPERLANYDILIVPTIAGYHDQPQKNSLMYMSDLETQNIENFVQNGGMMVTDINIGRNTPDGTDRILKKGQFDQETFLGRISGVTFKELETSKMSLTDTEMNIWKHQVMKPKSKEIWRPVAVQTGNNVRILGKWQSEAGTYPGILLNRYGKGKVFILPSFYILHPADDGGLSTEREINDFYKLVYDTYVGKRRFDIQLSPWKNAHTSVYCQTFDDGGNKEQYQRIFRLIKKHKLPTVFFVTPNIDNEIQDLLKKQAYISIQGHSYNHPDFRKRNYFQTEREFLSNRNYWHKQFKGFRFPYVSNSFWGMYALNEWDFLYDTSIAANHFEFIRGSVVPYNIPIFKDDFFLTLDVLEVSQIFRSDWYYYQKVLDKKPYNIEAQKQDAKAFNKYLFDYYEKVVKPNNGVMVYLGHPMYSGISDVTLQPLEDLLDYLKTQNVWITSLNEVAERWKKLEKLQVKIIENQQFTNIHIDGNNAIIKGLTFVLKKKPVKIISLQDYKLTKKQDKYYLVCDLKGNLDIKLQY